MHEDIPSPYIPSHVFPSPVLKKVPRGEKRNKQQFSRGQKSVFSKFCYNGTTIFNILDSTSELNMTKYIIGEMFSSGGATLYKNPSDQTVIVPKC